MTGRTFIVAIGVCLAAVPAHAAVITLHSYDPAQTYGGHTWSSTSDALASQFTLPTVAANYTLEEFRVRISYTNVATTPVTVCIWANDNGKPGNLIWSQNEPDVNGPTTDAASYSWWNTFDLSGASLTLSSGTVLFAGYASSDFADIAPSWSADSSSMDGIQGSWYRSASSGQWSFQDYDRKMELDVVPEPATLSLLAIGACLRLLRRRR